jgi:hypothetical protein
MSTDVNAGSAGSAGNEAGASKNGASPNVEDRAIGTLGFCPVDLRTLSRRDYMIVARQFIAWNTFEDGIRPVGTV